MDKNNARTIVVTLLLINIVLRFDGITWLIGVTRAAFTPVGTTDSSAQNPLAPGITDNPTGKNPQHTGCICGQNCDCKGITDDQWPYKVNVFGFEIFLPDACGCCPPSHSHNLGGAQCV